MTMQKKRKPVSPDVRLALARKQFDLGRQEICDTAAVSYRLEGRGAVTVSLWDDGDPDTIHYIPRAGIQELLAEMGVSDTAHVLELIDAYQPGQEFVAFIIYPVEHEEDGVIYVAAAILTREKDTRATFSTGKADYLN